MPLQSSPPQTRMRTLLTILCGLGLFAFAARPLSAQLGAGVAGAKLLEPTTNSSAAIEEFNAALRDINNIHMLRGTAHLRRAIDADPSLGVARAMYGVLATGLTPAQREEELNRAVADASRASTPELLIAVATRAEFRNDLTQAEQLWRSAAGMLPNDPNIAFRRAMLLNRLPGNGTSDIVAPMRTLTTRFPDFAPSYNILAYSLWLSGDRGGAMKSVETYIAKAPGEPNPYDSHAELLQWSGKYEDAIAEYRKALQIDPGFTGASLGLAEVYTLQGKFELARNAITEAIPRLTSGADKVSYQRQIASIYALEGNGKLTMVQLGKVIDEGKAGNVPNVTGPTHLSMALIDALLGDSKSIAGHLAMTGSEVPAIDKAYISAFAYAIAKQTPQARTAREELSRAITGSTTETNARMLPIVDALLLMNDGRASEAVATISQTDLATPVTRAVLGLAYQQQGNIAAARSLRDEVLGDKMLNLDTRGNVLSRMLAKRIN